MKNFTKKNKQKVKSLWKYDTYEDIKKNLRRATEVTMTLYEISESFARQYLHRFNKSIFSIFILEVNKVNGILKGVWDTDWEQDLFGISREINVKKEILNKCLVKLNKDAYFRLKYWKFIQKDLENFKKI